MFKKELTVDDMLAVHDAVMTHFENPTMFAKQLDAIRVTGYDKPIISRWQSVVTVWMGALLHSAVAYGYPNSMEGVEKFTQAYDEMSRSHTRGAELQAAAKERWGILFKQGLGMDVEKEDITLRKAQEIVQEQCNAMQEEPFLKEVEEAMHVVRGKLGAGTTEEEAKMKMQEQILHMLMPVQMEVYGNHGYEGDEGYIRMQAALLNHHGDEQIMYFTAVATTNLFRRAGKRRKKSTRLRSMRMCL